MSIPEPIPEPSSPGIQLPCRLSQQDFNDFADLSGDHNPIHVDPAFAAHTAFGATVAHGMLLYSRLEAALRQHWPQATVGSQQLMFPAPCYADEVLTLHLAPIHGGSPAPRIRMQVRKPDGRLGLDGEADLTPASPAPKLEPDTAGTPARTEYSLGADTPAHNLPRFQSLARGQQAQLQRSFTPHDLQLWASLAGMRPVPEHVPGPLLAALFSYLLGEELPGHGTNYLKQSLLFHQAVDPDETLYASVTIRRLRGDKALVDLDTSCHNSAGQMVCSGRALVRFNH